MYHNYVEDGSKLSRNVHENYKSNYIFSDQHHSGFFIEKIFVY